MENAVESLKIAFAVMMFAMALALSISSFSKANSTVEAIISMRDRETEYTYVEPSRNLSRTVGVETIVPSMYRAYKENIEIYFLDRDGGPLTLYYKTNSDGDNIIENGRRVGINYIDLALENFASSEQAVSHLNILLSNSTVSDDIYRNQICHTEGLYEYLARYKFEERLGEYYQGEGTTKIKKRVITYKVVD